MNKLIEPKFWVCIIGPIADDKLPAGADFPPRMAAYSAVVEMTGDNTKCNSGWYDEATYLRIMDVKYRPNVPEPID